MNDTRFKSGDKVRVIRSGEIGYILRESPPFGYAIGFIESEQAIEAFYPTELELVDLPKLDTAQERAVKITTLVQQGSVLQTYALDTELESWLSQGGAILNITTEFYTDDMERLCIRRAVIFIESDTREVIKG